MGSRGYRGSGAAPYRIRKLFIQLDYATVTPKRESLISYGEVGHMRKWVQRISYVLLTLLVLALLVGFTYEQVGRAGDARQLSPRVGQAVDIGGRTLNLYCSGNGAPTVILETGGNSPGYSLLLQQSKMAAFTRACWYDRAGVGWSDPPSSPRTGASIASDLHEALRRAGVLPPYVMAGGSVGGEYVLIYTARYPTDVAGLVLVDSATPDQRDPDFMVAPINRLSGRTRHLICTALPALMRFGIIRYVGSRERRPPSPDFTPEQSDTLTRLEAQPKAYRTDAEQACAATDEGRIVPRTGTNPDIDNAVRNAGSLGDRPLVVLTAGRYWAPPGFEKEAAEYHEVRVHQLQASLVRLSTRGRQVVVDADHGMTQSPESIVIAVRQVVDEVRANNN
jgi:pimeloyl-ACP methyl ester carboxylesterase